MLCYRCGSHVPDSSESCSNCGQKLTSGGVRQATATFSRKRLGQNVLEGAPFKPGDVVAKRYHIKDTVGAGPLGFVFRAQDREMDVEVALKVINPRLVQTPDERKQFAKAVRAGRKLAHPNLVRFYDEGEDHDRPFYTSQFLEGLSLRKIIDLRIGKGQFFSLKEIEPILGQIVAAADAVHEVGPHSDLKPENVVVLPDLLKVTDFGVGLAIPRLPFVQAVKVRKADRYLAPEFIAGGEVDHRADIYSLGVIIGEMLVGLTPDGAIPELTQRNPELPPAIEGLYRKALNHNPLVRFKTAQELFAEFVEIVRKVSPPPIKSRPEPTSAVPVPRPRPSSAALQLVPRRISDQLPPPVDLPPEADEGQELTESDVKSLPPDAVQPMDGSTMSGLIPPPPVEAHEDTEVFDSSPILAEPRPERKKSATRWDKKRIAVWLSVLTVVGLMAGSAGGYWILSQTGYATQVTEPAPPTDLSPATEPGEQPVVAGGSEQNPAATQPAVSEQPAAERAAAEKAAAEKAAAEKAAAEKAAAEKAAAEKAAAEKLAAETAAAERAASEKAAAEKAALEIAVAERAAAEREKAEKEKTALAAAKGPVKGGPALGGQATCPPGMRQVPSGSFRMGTAKGDPMMGFDERVLASVEVAAFCIDQYEFPNRRGVTPTTNVSWNDAKRFCEAKGKRLCTEQEWEKACKGPGNARFPYGNEFDGNVCNTEDEDGEDRLIAASGQFAKCISGYGVADMSGNVAEWTSAPYASNADKTVKGGAFDRPDYAARCSARKNGAPSSRSAEVGFRCCADLGK